MNDGYILLHRKIIKEWEWYSNINDTRVWLHCLLKANWEDGWFEGIKIPRGSFATSYKNLAKETGISVQQLRTSLEHLKSTHNITHETNKQFSIITINNYDKYQLINTLDNKRATNEQQTINNNINNNNKEQINKKENISKDISKKKVQIKYFESLKVNTIFNEFLELRKKIKAVNSDRAIKTLVNKLNNYDEDTQYKMIENSIVNSWKDVYELKVQDNKLPRWFDNEPKERERTEDEERELQELIRGY